MNASSDGDHQRDAASLRVLGGFFLVLGSVVTAATPAAWERFHAAIVNACSGLLLIGVGVGMFVIARRMTRKA